MKKQIYNSVIYGAITAPPSKSITQRALAAALLSKEDVFLNNVGFSNDDISTTKIIQSLGADVSYLEDGVLKIKSHFNPISLESLPAKDLKVVQCGESGLATRMFSPIISLMNQRFVLEGEGSLFKRQLNIPEDIFKLLNVKFGSRTGRAPLRIKGPMMPQNIEIDGSVTSQFLTGLLFAYSYLNVEDLTIHVKKLKSKPYIDLTLDVMKAFNMKMPENRNYEQFYFPKNSQPVEPSSEHVLRYTVESDWSNAAMLMVLAATSGEVTIEGLKIDSFQGDKIILEILKQIGADVEVGEKQIKVKKNQLNAFEFNAENHPDLFPPLVALAASCHGVSVIEGVERLKNKESNRAKCLQFEFGRLGIDIDIQDNKMLIKGGVISGGKVKSHNDHRIAMALTIAGINAISRVELGDAEAVDKSYPYFFSDLKKLGAHIDSGEL